MKLITRLCVVASLAGILAGCSTKQEIPANLNFTGEAAALLSSGISAPATETQVELSFQSARSWSAKAEDNATQAHASWIVIHPAAGAAGDATVLIFLADNASMESRSGVVTFSSGDIAKTIQVTQAGRERHPITEVVLSDSTLELEVGATHTLVATVLPSFTDDDKTVTWSSSNSAVVSVSNGELKALKVGSAVITAKAGGKSASCTVTVKEEEEPVVPDPVPVTSVTLNKTSLSLTEGESATLVATVLPDNADDKKVTWTSSDPSVATVLDGLVTALKAGTTVITAKAGDKTATCAVTVKAKEGGEPEPDTGSDGEDMGEDVDVDPWE